MAEAERVMAQTVRHCDDAYNALQRLYSHYAMLDLP